VSFPHSFGLQNSVDEVSVDICSRDAVIRSVNTNAIVLHAPFSFPIDETTASAYFRRRKRILCIEADTAPVSNAPERKQNDGEAPLLSDELNRIEEEPSDVTNEPVNSELFELY
jgi:hypothetical protein